MLSRHVHALSTAARAVRAAARREGVALLEVSYEVERIVDGINAHLFHACFASLIHASYTGSHFRSSKGLSNITAAGCRRDMATASAVSWCRGVFSLGLRSLIPLCFLAQLCRLCVSDHAISPLKRKVRPLREPLLAGGGKAAGRPPCASRVLNWNELEPSLAKIDARTASLCSERDVAVHTNTQVWPNRERTRRKRTATFDSPPLTPLPPVCARFGGIASQGNDRAATGRNDSPLWVRRRQCCSTNRQLEQHASRRACSKRRA